MKNFDAPSRRKFLASAAALTAAGLSATSPNPAFAKAPPRRTQAPGFYRFKVGAFEATIVSDGPLHFGPPSGQAFVGLSAESMNKVLTENFLPTDDVLLDQNALVINTGKQLVLFDTGTGSYPLMGKDAGRLLANLRSAGIQPKDIDAVVITHAHADHCFGLMSEKGTRNFPNAQIHIAQSDLEFWTDEKNAVNDMIKGMIAGTRQKLLPNRDRMVFFKDGQEILPGIQAMAAPGHTVGHTVFMITSEGKSLLNAADIAHHHVISTQTPHLPFAFDTDGPLGVASRMKVFDMLASTRTPMVGYHFPWPGLGYIGKRGDAYRYYPEPMRMVL